MVHNHRMMKMKDNTTQQQVTISRTVKRAKKKAFPNLAVDQITSDTERTLGILRTSVKVAKKILKDHNKGNRPLGTGSKPYNNVKSAMQKGCFLNHTTLLFSKSGQLLDGQHRLTALVETNKPQNFIVGVGFPDEVLTVADTNKTRGDSVRLYLGLKEKWTDVKDWTLAQWGLLNSCRKMQQMEHVTSIQNASTEISNFSKTQTEVDVRKYAQKNKKFLVGAISCIAKQFTTKEQTKPIKLSRWIYTVPFFMFFKKDAEKALDFQEELIDGKNKGKTSPITHARDALINCGGKHGKDISNYEAYATIVFAMKKYLDGEKIYSNTKITFTHLND